MGAVLAKLLVMRKVKWMDKLWVTQVLWMVSMMDNVLVLLLGL